MALSPSNSSNNGIGGERVKKVLGFKLFIFLGFLFFGTKTEHESTT